MVRQEFYGFSYRVGAVAVFLAFNLFAFNYLPGPHLYWFGLSLAALAWISFRIYERFDSSRLL